MNLPLREQAMDSTSEQLARATPDPETLRKLASAVRYAFRNTFFYARLFRKVFRNTEITEAAVAQKFANLPFTSKEDVVRNFPYGFVAVERTQLLHYFESSGTTGNTIHSTKSASFFSAADMAADVKRRFSPDLGISSTDVVVNALPFALTSSGIGFQQAAMAAGAMCVTVDSGNMLSSHAKHLDLLRDLEATVFVASLPLLYASLLLVNGSDPRTELRHLRAIQLCGLPTMPAGKKKIRDTFGVPVFDTYGLSEFGATTFTCAHGEMHVHDNDFFVEVIDPRTGELNASGVGGEIVITTLNREASPKIRYRTGDFGILHSERCACGRGAPRLTVKGRLRDAARFGERFRLPIDFEEVIYGFEDVVGLYRLKYEPLSERDEDREQTRATLTIDVRDPNKKGLRAEIEQAVQSEVTPNATVDLVRLGSAQSEILDQSRFANVRTIKSAVVDDQRPQEWLVTY